MLLGRMVIGWLLALLLAMAQAAPAAAEEEVRLATLEWRPYVGQHLENYGWCAEVITEAFRRSGYKATIDFMPWKRVLRSVLHNTYEGGFPAYDTPERRVYAWFSEPLGTSEIGFFVRKSKYVTYKNISDLKGMKIGVMKGFANTDEFDAADYLYKEEALTEAQNLAKLIKGRIDLALMDRDVANLALKETLSEFAAELEFIQPPLSLNFLYLMISKKSPRGKELIRAYNSGLDQMKKDGALQDILRKHGIIK